MKRWLERFGAQRQRLARLVLIGGVALVAASVLPSVPREQAVEFALGPGHAQVVELSVAYTLDGEEFKGVRFGFPQGAPERVLHRVSLPAGQFVLHCSVRERGGAARSVTLRLDSPADGVVRFRLWPVGHPA